MPTLSLARLALALALFAGVTAFALSPAGARWDRAVATWVERAAPGPDVPAVGLVFLADPEVVGPGLVLAGAVLLARRDRRGGWKLLWLAAAAAVVSLVAVALKYMIVHPGPPPEFVRQIARPAVTTYSTPYGFPSGHTMRTTLLAGTLLWRLPIASAAIVLAIMASLVYLGDHWATEVFGGLCLGWACVELARGGAARLGLR